ncbi:MAG TPA: hypothetical protein VER03_02010 [Bryobacteraceae bacterium]|nr:hypothetical protein [Bryobacteraceae bacterium]
MNSTEEILGLPEYKISEIRPDLVEGKGQVKAIVPGLRKSATENKGVARRAKDHWDGISRSRVAEREAISGATVERHAKEVLQR